MEKQESSKVTRVFKTVGIWLLLALAAAAIAVLVSNVRSAVQLGIKGSWLALWNGFPGAAHRGSWATFMDSVILIASLIVAVRIMYPPKDLEEPRKVPPSKPSDLTKDVAANYDLR